MKTNKYVNSVKTKFLYIYCNSIKLNLSSTSSGQITFIKPANTTVRLVAVVITTCQDISSDRGKYYIYSEPKKNSKKYWDQTETVFG